MPKIPNIDEPTTGIEIKLIVMQLSSMHSGLERVIQLSNNMVFGQNKKIKFCFYLSVCLSVFFHQIC